MSANDSAPTTIRALRFHSLGAPTDVLRLERVEVPRPGAGRIRVRVHACGLNPADWALCRGLFPGALPRGIGLDVAGIVDAVGEGVTTIAVGERVLGAADYAGAPVAGASDQAILNHWARVPEGLDLVHAAALPLVVETAFRSLENLRVTAGQTLLIHGAGTMVGFAAVQLALARGTHVFATAGQTYADRLRALGAKVTSYGEGLADRVLALAGGPVDLTLDAAPVSGVLPELLRTVGGEPRRVLTVSDFEASNRLGIRNSFTEDATQRYDMLGEFARWAAEGTLTVPIAKTFPLEDWREALALSQGGHAQGKLLLLGTPARS